ncbi:phosphatase PAP2 family protein, partial [Myxococcota bacterium]|nr:phosphatase PAP2 family protein [Myxococcota bacterium]
CGVGKSFASGHAAVAFAFATSAAPAVRFGAAVFVPLAALVAGSRVLLGQHYPSDIVGGALLGASIGLGGLVARRRVDAWRAARAKVRQG